MKKKKDVAILKFEKMMAFAAGETKWKDDYSLDYAKKIAALEIEKASLAFKKAELQREVTEARALANEMHSRQLALVDEKASRVMA